MKLKWLMQQEGAGGAGGGADDWRKVLPEELRNDPTIAKYKSVTEAAKGLVEANGLIGRSVRPPGPNATPEAKKEFVDKLLAIDPALVYAPDGDPAAVDRMWKRLGRPEKPEEYDVPQASVEAGLNPEDLRALAVKGGLTKAQFSGLVELMTNANLESRRVAALERLALDTEWGQAKEERTLAAKAAAMKMGLNEQEVAALSPRVLKAFYATAKAVGVNQGEFRQHGSGGTPRVSPAEAQEELAKIRANPAYWDKFKDPALHEKLVKDAVRLTEALG